ncbi:hypothetical protein OUY22_17625 [Nonomuraea sp. MCN248]|uniref:Uncharacterized protein n=1 Tax=Nonomuraea corallina TaxID=2989783 RepID=A0ABT4SDG4_9ACTN|nr:hypothetical protein [Nonomuraea corallina]MDA0635243.1 hypothetical protein [Nonomuraea corallina]
MSDRLDELERRIDELRAGVRRAVRARDGVAARALRAELRTAEQAWDTLVSGEQPAAKARGARLVTVREQVHQALALLGAPAQARLVVAVSGAFLAGTIRSSQLTSLRRDEERSFRSSPFGRPYYLCAALTDRLSPARGYLTVSTWPVRRRVVGPLSPRVDFLTCAISIAEHAAGPGGRSPEGERLLVRMARNIPGAGDEVPPDPARVAEAARRELAVHAERDAADREELAGRAGAQLDDVARLFGAATLTTVPRSVTAMRGGR